MKRVAERRAAFKWVKDGLQDGVVVNLELEKERWWSERVVVIVSGEHFGPCADVLIEGF